MLFPGGTTSFAPSFTSFPVVLCVGLKPWELCTVHCDMTVVACWRGFKGITSDITSRHNFTANSLILCLLQPFLPSPLRCFLSLICDLKVNASLLWYPVKCYYLGQVPRRSLQPEIEWR